jgi:hypothetical protein
VLKYEFGDMGRLLGWGWGAFSFPDPAKSSEKTDQEAGLLGLGLARFVVQRVLPPNFQMKSASEYLFRFLLNLWQVKSVKE